MKKLFLLLFVFLVIPLVNAAIDVNDATFIAGESTNLTINMNNETFNESIYWTTTSEGNLTWEVLVGEGAIGEDNYTFANADNGSVILNLSSIIAEEFTVTFYEVDNASNNGTSTVTVNPAAHTKFDINWTGGITAGENKEVVITAQDEYNNTVTEFNDAYVHLSLNDEQMRYLVFENGTYTYTLNYIVAGDLKIEVDYFNINDFVTTTVVFGIPTKFSLTHNGYGMIDDVVELTLEAQDEYNNTITNYTGLVGFEPEDNDTIDWSKVDAEGNLYNGNDQSYQFFEEDLGNAVLGFKSSVAENYSIFFIDIADNSINVSTFLDISNPEITVAPTSGDIGDEINVAGSGFAGNSVDVYLGGELVIDNADLVNGAFDDNFNVPQLASGVYNVTVGSVSESFTVEETELGYEIVESNVSIIFRNPTINSTEDGTFTLNNLGNMPLDITNIALSDLVIEGTNYSAEFDSTAFELGWENDKEVTLTLKLLNYAPAEGTYTGTITVTDSDDEEKTIELYVEIEYGTPGIGVSPSSLTISEDDEESIGTATFKVSNTGTLDLTDITLEYDGDEESLITLSDVIFDLDENEDKDVTLTANITALGIGNYSGTIKVSHADLTDISIPVTVTVTDVLEEVLRIEDLDSNVENNLENGDEIEVKPGEDLTFDIELENTASFDIEDIEILFIISDIDDGDDLEEEVVIDEIRDGDKETVELSFEIPYELEDDSYEIIIEIVGDGDDGNDYEIDWTLDLKIDKKSHDVEVSKADLASSTLQCSRSTYLDLEVVNIGSHDEDEVVIVVESDELGISYIVDDVEIDEGEKYSDTISIYVGDNVAAGDYIIEIYTYYDDDEYYNKDITDYKSVTLTVEDCQTTTPPAGQSGYIPPTTPTVPDTIPTTTEFTFSETTGYTVLLVLANLVLISIIVFMGIKIFGKKY